MGSAPPVICFRCSSQPKVADAASELPQEVFGKEKSPCRLVYGVASLPLGAPAELEIIFEVAGSFYCEPSFTRLVAAGRSRGDTVIRRAD